MILDNADDVSFARREHGNDGAIRHEFSIAQYLPQRDGGAVLITSRDNRAAFALTGKADYMISIQPLNEKEARTLIDRKIPTQLGDDNEREKLASSLELIPLALTQAAAYITRRQRMTIGKYLDLLEAEEEKEGSVLKTEESDIRRDPEVPNSVVRAWQITFRQIRKQNDLSAELLSRMSLFDKQDVPEFLLRESGPDFAFEEAIETLLGYAIITMQRNETSFSMHRLVQLATRDWLRQNEDLARQVEAALKMLDQSYPTGNYENWTTCEMLEPHAESLLRNGAFSDCVRLSRAQIFCNRAWYYTEQGKYEIAEAMAKEGMHDRVELLGAEHPDTLTSMGGLALTYRYQGRWKEAKELQLQVMETRKRVLGAEHPDTLISMGNLASTYRNQGRWKEAEELQLQVMETHKRVLGAEHPNTLISMGNLASTYDHQGRWKEAEELELQVMETRKKVLGAEHPATLITMSNLAFTLKGQNRNQEALGLMKKCVKLREQVLGLEHPHTIYSQDTLNEWEVEGLDLQASGSSVG